MDGLLSYVLSKKYTEDSLIGIGALKGAPAEVKSIEELSDGYKITLKWEDKNGVEHLDDFTLKNGEEGEQGPKGDTGISIVNITKTSTQGLVDTYTIKYSDNTSSTFQITNGMPSKINDFESLTKKEDYLYEITYTNLDYDYAKDYIKHHNPFIPVLGACSGVRKGNIYGRNYDWYYNHQPTFIVHTPSINGNHSSLTVCPGFGDLTETFVDSREYSDFYKLLPFIVLDGINDSNLTCSLNVVPAGDWGKTTGTIPAIEKREELSIFILARFILDHFDNAATAASYLRDYCSIYAPDKFECHYMIADESSTYIIEFINNAVEIIEVTDTRPYMTNFYIKDMEFDTSTGLVNRTSLTPYGSGIERYELIASNYNSIIDEEDMIELMSNKLKYTNAYDSSISPYWYTEFVGKTDRFGDLTVLSPAEDFTDIIAYEKELFNNRTRDVNETWQTVHTSVYNIDKKKLYVIPQEGDNIHKFSLEIETSSGGGGAEIDDSTISTTKVWSSNKTNAELTDKASLSDDNTFEGVQTFGENVQGNQVLIDGDSGAVTVTDNSFSNTTVTIGSLSMTSKDEQFWGSLEISPKEGIEYVNRSEGTMSTVQFPNNDGTIATEEYVDNVLENKVDINQGTTNVGKMLKVGVDGKLTLVTPSEGVEIDDTTTSTISVWSSSKVNTELLDKQDNLPTVINDRYLHTNATTGELEWSTVNSEESIDLDIGESNPSEYLWSKEYKTVRYSVPYGRGYDDYMPDTDNFGSRADYFTGVIYNLEDSCIIKGSVNHFENKIKYTYIGVVNTDGEIRWSCEYEDKNIKQYFSYEFPEATYKDTNKIAFDKSDNEFKICKAEPQNFLRYINSENDDICIVSLKDYNKVYLFNNNTYRRITPTNYYIIMDSEDSFYYEDEDYNVHNFTSDNFIGSEQDSIYYWDSYNIGSGLPIPEDDDKILVSSDGEWIQSDKPTKLSDFTNDEEFIDKTVNNLTNYYLKTETYTQSEINNLIADINQFNVLVVATLPTTDIDTHTIYFVPKETAGTNDIYNEYIYINNDWELIGNTEIDLSQYYTKTEIDGLLDDKADKSTTYTKTETDTLFNTKQNKVIKTTVADFDDAVADAENGDLITVTDVGGGYDFNVVNNLTSTSTEDALSANMGKELRDTTYTKTESDELLNDKADKSTTYTKTEVNALIPDISGKADKSTTYTKTEVNTALSEKANTSSVYTKTESDNKFNKYITNNSYTIPNFTLNANGYKEVAWSSLGEDMTPENTIVTLQTYQSLNGDISLFTSGTAVFLYSHSGGTFNGIILHTYKFR